MEKVYCEYCCQPTEYTVEDDDLFGKVNGRYVFYKGKRARCNKCGCIVYPREIIDYNNRIVRKTVLNEI